MDNVGYRQKLKSQNHKPAFTSIHFEGKATLADCPSASKTSEMAKSDGELYKTKPQNGHGDLDANIFRISLAQCLHILSTPKGACWVFFACGVLYKFQAHRNMWIVTRLNFKDKWLQLPHYRVLEPLVEWRLVPWNGAFRPLAWSQLHGVAS